MAKRAFRRWQINNVAGSKGRWKGIIGEYIGSKIQEQCIMGPAMAHKANATAKAWARAGVKANHRATLTAIAQCRQVLRTDNWARKAGIHEKHGLKRRSWWHTHCREILGQLQNYNLTTNQRTCKGQKMMRLVKSVPLFRPHGKSSREKMVKSQELEIRQPCPARR